MERRARVKLFDFYANLCKHLIENRTSVLASGLIGAGLIMIRVRCVFSLFVEYQDQQQGIRFVTNRTREQ